MAIARRTRDVYESALAARGTRLRRITSAHHAGFDRGIVLDYDVHINASTHRHSPLKARYGHWSELHAIFLADLAAGLWVDEYKIEDIEPRDRFELQMSTLYVDWGRLLRVRLLTLVCGRGWQEE